MTVSVVTLGEAGRSEIVNVDLYRFYCHVGLIATVSPGAVLTYEVAVSADGDNWNPHDTMQDLTASQNGNISYPVPYVSLNITAWTSGSVTLGVCQML